MHESIECAYQPNHDRPSYRYCSLNRSFLHFHWRNVGWNVGPTYPSCWPPHLSPSRLGKSYATIQSGVVVQAWQNWRTANGTRLLLDLLVSRPYGVMPPVHLVKRCPLVVHYMVTITLEKFIILPLRFFTVQWLMTNKYIHYKSSCQGFIKIQPWSGSDFDLKYTYDLFSAHAWKNWITFFSTYRFFSTYWFFST